MVRSFGWDGNGLVWSVFGVCGVGPFAFVLGDGDADEDGEEVEQVGEEEEGAMQ